MKNTVKSLVLAAVTLLAFFALSLIACDDGSGNGTTPPPAHVHQWGDWTVTRAATCTMAGSQTKVCALDATHTETQVIPVDTNAHDYHYVEGSGTAPTCTEDGNGNEVCSYNSSHIRSGVIIPKLGHNYEWETATRATCSAVGVKTGTCTRDPNHTTAGEIPIDPNAHDWQAAPGSVAPTCTTAGSGTVVCSYNAEHTQTADVIPALGHDSGEWHTTSEADCEHDGAKELRCTRDNFVLETAAITALGHDYQYTETTAPTCTTAGVETGTCTHDATHTTTRAVTALGHNYANWTQTTAPTCTTAGVETGTCTHDGTHTTTRTVPIDPNAHDYANWTQTTAPTCTTAGVETGTCTHDATHTTTRAVPIADAHDWKNNYTQTTAPTCTTAGIETDTCNRNEAHTRLRLGAAALGHDWEWVETSDGIETETCTRCAATNGIRLTYSLGDTGPGGGKIFYIDATGFTMTDNNQVCHYLEAAPADMTSTLAWGSVYTITDIAGTETAIGTGRKNTSLILATDANAPAAKACKEYNGGGKTDWFLPGKDELNQLYVSSYGNMGTDYYWSSSKDGNSAAWYQSFSNGSQYAGGPGSAMTVRAVRAF